MAEISTNSSGAKGPPNWFVKLCKWLLEEARLHLDYFCSWHNIKCNRFLAVYPVAFAYQQKP